MDRSFQEMIQLTITTWTSENGDLYEYKSSQQLQKIQFRSVQFQLPMPEKSPIYYFFHLINKKANDDRYQYILQRRKDLKSDLSLKKTQEINKLVLIGGIRLYRKFIKNKTYACIQPIQAQQIQRIKVNKKYEQIQHNLPFLIIRTFKKGYPLKLNQVIKFGKVQFQVIEINTSKVRQVEYGYGSDQIMNLDQTHKQTNMNQTERQQSNSQSSILKQCKICYMNDQDDPQNALITPCDCKGSSKYIHINCLKQWIHQKLKKMKDQNQGAFYQTNLLFCQICKKKFPKAISKNGKVYGLLKFLQESYPYVALKSKFNVINQSDNMFYVSFQETDSIRVGRLLDNGVILEQQTVSRRHAQFQMKNQKIFIKDDESKYGTLVYEDNMEIRLQSKIKAIQIGNAVFSYKIVLGQNNY